MSTTGSNPAAHCVRLHGRLTIATVQDSRNTLLEALRGSPAVELDCDGGTAFDIAFVQLLESARALAQRDGIGLSLRQPVPPPLAAILAEGGFRDWTSPVERSAA
ncbi:STAS domain-containing protein [Falsiroseomonas stagni]|uniref:STAS domain-containing protein n=1 Tax=Falsiroseomonas stagni DSM 19981 TaxID=1123062 RepID=A0A1I4E4S0_9PROT|nr:STAS domain-containing protein [Falsiroseomonas stagni]SFL00755.1 STAS domain-containing protein [Falsiroseomonas stagni DSM 19981]